MNNKENIGQIILYQADNAVKLEVKLENDTVWLTQSQIAELFGTKRPAITKHLVNIFKSDELCEKSVSSILELTANDGKTYQTKFYNLDAILSVGYRVNSINATKFRQWANNVLKEYLLRGYAVNIRQRNLVEQVENRLAIQDSKINEINGTVSKLNEKVDFLVKTSKPLKQGVFFQGQIFDAYVFFEHIIQKAKAHIILIDSYIDLSILERFSKKKPAVEIDIYTSVRAKITELDVEKFNAQYSKLTLNRTDKMHDRFLIIDGVELYHIGASLKDLGTKCFAFEKMDDAKILIPEILKHV